MSMSDHIKQQVLQELFAKKCVVLVENGKTAIFCFTLLSERTSTHTENILKYLICYTMSGTEQPKEQPQIDVRGSNPIAINQFLIFFLYWVHMFSFSFFHLLIFFILRGFVHLI